MSGVAWGLTAALLWGVSALVLARPARILGARTTLAWTMAIGAAAVLPVALIVDGVPTAPGEEWAWAIVAGVGFVVGSGCWLLGVRLGDVSVVTPIVATDGAIAAVIAIATGEVLGAATLVSLGIVASGVVLVCLQPRHANVTTPPAAVFAALGAAVAFGIVFTASGRTAVLGALWTVAVSRVVGAVLSVPPEALRRHVPPRWTLPWLDRRGAARRGRVRRDRQRRGRGRGGRVGARLPVRGRRRGRRRAPLPRAADAAAGDRRRADPDRRRRRRDRAGLSGGQEPGAPGALTTTLNVADLTALDELSPSVCANRSVAWPLPLARKTSTTASSTSASDTCSITASS